MTNDIAPGSFSELEVTTPFKKDFTLEVDCVDLLCQQDALLSKMAEGGSLCFDKLDLAKQMLVRYLEFCEQHIEEQELASLSERIGVLYEQMRELESSLMGTTWRTVRRLLGAKMADDLEARSKYQELGKEFADFHASIFTYCVERTSAPSSVKGPFLEGVKAFLTEIATKW